ncbi:unnamed protein product [Cuscuta campestris]|uniref:Uncharacterized protein n=1 Tax=Cuscuta campestris TaxID=132261 RepID=A0A484L1R3_9ASTE|nr:unnamed protein product [Cuscuta campestris]
MPGQVPPAKIRRISIRYPIGDGRLNLPPQIFRSFPWSGRRQQLEEEGAIPEEKEIPAAEDGRDVVILGKVNGIGRLNFIRNNQIWPSITNAGWSGFFREDLQRFLSTRVPLVFPTADSPIPAHHRQILLCRGLPNYNPDHLYFVWCVVEAAGSF